MNQKPPKTNLRRSRRQAPKTSTRVRCYKGPLGLGKNLAVTILDVSETGIRLVLESDLPKGQEVEVALVSSATRTFKALAEVIWSVPTTGGHFCVGVSFQKPIPYGDLLALARS
jgi:hypothetical protein